MIIDYRERALELISSLTRGPVLELISHCGVRAEPGWTKLRTNNAVGDQKIKPPQAFYNNRLRWVAPEVPTNSSPATPALHTARLQRTRQKVVRIKVKYSMGAQTYEKLLCTKLFDLARASPSSKPMRM